MCTLEFYGCQNVYVKEAYSPNNQQSNLNPFPGSYQYEWSCPANMSRDKRSVREVSGTCEQMCGYNSSDMLSLLMFYFNVIFLQYQVKDAEISFELLPVSLLRFLHTLVT